MAERAVSLFPECPQSQSPDDAISCDPYTAQPPSMMSSSNVSFLLLSACPYNVIPGPCMVSNGLVTHFLVRLFF